MKEGIAVDPPTASGWPSCSGSPRRGPRTGRTLTGLDDYVKRAPADSKAIYYLGGPDLASIRKSPNLEIFRKRNLEVLLLTDPIDEFVMTSLHGFDGKTLTSIDAADLELPGLEPGEAGEPDEPAARAGSARSSSCSARRLGSRVESVRASKRLTDSPCCLVNADGGLSLQMQRLLKQNNREFPVSRRILEVNPDAPLIRRLVQLSANPAE